jgi:hypothetical protein
MKAVPPKSALGYLAMRAHMHRIGIQPAEDGAIDPRSLEHVVGQLDRARDIGFEALGGLKKKGVLWNGEGISADATARTRALADEAKALALELEGLTKSLSRVSEEVRAKLSVRERFGSGPQIDPQVFEVAMSPAARAVGDRLVKLDERLPQVRERPSYDPQHVDLIELKAIDPGAVTELTQAVARLGIEASTYIGELSRIRWHLDDAGRYYRENPPGAPPARAVLVFEVMGRAQLVTLPKELIVGTDFENRVIEDMKEPEPIVLRSDELSEIVSGVNQTYGMASRAISTLIRLADRISGPSPLALAEQLLPAGSVRTVVRVADAIEEMVQTTRLPSTAMFDALRHAFAPLEELRPKEPPPEAMASAETLQSWLDAHDGAAIQSAIDEKVPAILERVAAAAHTHATDERAFLSALGAKKS